MKEIKIQQLEERLELGSWLSGGDNGSECTNCCDGTSTTSQQPTTTIESTR